MTEKIKLMEKKANVKALGIKIFRDAKGRFMSHEKAQEKNVKGKTQWYYRDEQKRHFIKRETFNKRLLETNNYNIAIRQLLKDDKRKMGEKVNKDVFDEEYRKITDDKKPTSLFKFFVDEKRQEKYLNRMFIIDKKSKQAKETRKSHRTIGNVRYTAKRHAQLNKLRKEAETKKERDKYTKQWLNMRHWNYIIARDFGGYDI